MLHFASPVSEYKYKHTQVHSIKADYDTKHFIFEFYFN